MLQINYSNGIPKPIFTRSVGRTSRSFLFRILHTGIVNFMAQKILDHNANIENIINITMKG